MGRIHAEGYAKLGKRIHLIFRSASGKRAKEFAERYGGEWHTDYSQAIEKADIVDICATHDLHMQMACEAFAAGKHVLIEKPIARTLEEADTILSAAEKAGVKFMVCENIAFHPHIQKIDQVIAGGDIGNIFLIEMSSLSFWSGIQQGGWRSEYEKIGGGVLIDLGSHYAYLALRWCQNIESIFARISHATFNMQGEDTAILVISNSNGLTITIHVSWGAPGAPYPPGIVIYGTKGTVVSSHDGLFINRNGSKEMKQTTLCDGSFMPLWWEAVRSAVRIFVECVEKNIEPPVTGRMGRDVLGLIKAAERSAKEGIAVRSISHMKGDKT
jgi:predicted dehydrogenase